MIKALGVLSRHSLSPSRQQLVGKDIETREVVLDPSDPIYSNDSMKEIDIIINVVAKGVAFN